MPSHEEDTDGTETADFVRSFVLSRGALAGFLRTRTLAEVLEGPWHATAHIFRTCLPKGPRRTKNTTRSKFTTRSIFTIAL